MAPTKYHKFRGGERCDECGARQWYAQDALRYCRNGHRLEGFADHEGDEDDFGTQGRVTRKKKEARQREAVKLTGDEGRELYLEILQLILIKQVHWLVEARGFPDDFADIVRSLWALRVRNLPLREREREGQGKRKGRKTDDESDAASSTLFGSQSEMGDSTDPDISDATTTSWAPDAARRWKLPKLVDTLALCYLGCLVRRLPVRVAEFHRWAQKGDIAYLAAFNGIPRNARDRLPAEYHRALQVKDHLPPGRLHRAIQDLVISYHANFEMGFPALNYVPPLITYITELTLPADVYTTAKCISEVLSNRFMYPVGGKRIRTMENPEVLLVTLVVVSAKLLYPLDGVPRPPRDGLDPRSTAFDWSVWQDITRERPLEERPNLLPGEEYKITPSDALNMDKTKLDDFMDWFEKMWIGDGEPKTAEGIREPFQGQQRLSERNTQAENDDINKVDRIKERCQALKQSMVYVQPLADDSELARRKQPRDLCPVWRKEEDLPHAARILYMKAAEAAAIPLSTLIRSTEQVERRIEVWCHQKRKQRRSKGKEKAILTDEDIMDEDS
ncbi:hypothetical protein F4780DRAFT_295605 [Xylariomycetidae sp. FL0641]|nr:hypothetical protein F4780DRAFT_295605 [Xylariomycetidae sp. FL0641]